jgi:hypothetical protein
MSDYTDRIKAVNEYMTRWKLYAREWNSVFGDRHPDPLIVSDQYLSFPVGWYLLEVIGSTDRTTMVNLRMSVSVATGNGLMKPALREVYHHPSWEYVNEIARQILTGDRLVFGEHAVFRTWTRDIEALVNRVHISRWNGVHGDPLLTRYPDLDDGEPMAYLGGDYS